MRGHYPQVGSLLLSLMIQHSRALCVKMKSCSRPVLNSDIVVTCLFLESIGNFPCPRPYPYLKNGSVRFGP